MRRGVSAIIVNFNGGDDLVRCVRSLLSQRHEPAEIIVVDNASSDNSLPTLASTFPQIISINSKLNNGFAGGANEGSRVATQEILLFLNPDIVLNENCLELMVEELSTSVGVVGPRLVIESDHEEEYGATLDLLGHPVGLNARGRPLYVSGCALATPRALFERLGGFDGRYFMFVEDVDYCWRVLLTGADVTVASEAKAFHRGGAVAAGGYVRSGRMVTTTLRVRLRERNTLATFLKCAPASSLIWIVPAQLSKCLFVAAVAVFLGRKALARELVSGLVWNYRELSETFRRRRATPHSRRAEREPMRRLLRRMVAVDLVLRFGLPSFADAESIKVPKSSGNVRHR